MATLPPAWEADLQQDKAPTDPVDFQRVSSTPGDSPTRTTLQASEAGLVGQNGEKASTFPLAFSVNNVNILCKALLSPVSHRNPIN